jgi:lipid II isoglutaminyl synthase (glutamine-hydrolysing)
VIRLPVLWIGKILVALARMRGGGGSAFPGLVVERLHPQLLAEQLDQLPGGCVIVTGTNGKTTTTKMLVTLLDAAGRRVVTNPSGSNMVRGLLSAVVEQSTWSGRLPGDLAVFEVDEPNVPAVARLVRPSQLLILNLHRDQLDRYGELERSATLLAEAVPLAGSVVLNADDPLVARLAGQTAPDRVRWFGVSPDLRAQLPDDANLLVGAAPAAAAVPFDQLAAGLESAVEDGDGQRVRIRAGAEDLGADLHLPGVYNATNLTAVVATLPPVGVAPAAVIETVAGLTPAFGRGERIELDDRAVVLQLVKNPSSFTQVIRTQLVAGADRDLLIAINDNFADGRDVSWLWDVDFEALAGRRDRIVATGLRAADLAVRLKYADLACDVEPDLEQALDRFVTGLAPGTTGFVVPTYTAMLDLRRLLGRRTDLKGFWE